MNDKQLAKRATTWFQEHAESIAPTVYNGYADRLDYAGGLEVMRLITEAWKVAYGEGYQARTEDEVMEE